MCRIIYIQLCFVTLFSCKIAKVDTGFELPQNVTLRIESRSGKMFSDIFRIDIRGDVASYFEGKLEYDKRQGLYEKFILVESTDIHFIDSEAVINVLVNRDGNYYFPAKSIESGVNYYSEPDRELRLYFMLDGTLQKRITINQTYPEVIEILTELNKVFVDKGLCQWLEQN